MKVPLLDLKAQYRSLKTELDAALLRVAESQVLALGPEVDQLEGRLAEFCGTRYALGVTSGTDALLLPLMALNLQPGDEVIVPTFSFFATAGVVARLRAVPVFVDIDPVSFCIDPEAIAAHIGPRTKAIIPVHLYGQCAAMDEINAIADANGIPVIEDAAQSIGAQYRNGRRAGSMGLAGSFSFYPTKNLGAFGDAGLVTTNDEELFQTMKLMRVHGGERRYYHRIIGGNFRMDAIQAAVLNVKFSKLAEWSAACRDHAELYSNLFIDAGLAQEEGRISYDEANSILLPKALYKSDALTDYHIYHQYVIRVPQRDSLLRYLQEREIGAGVYYPVPFHRQECFSYLDCNPHHFPVAEAAAQQVLALPIYPELRREQIEFVVESIAAGIRDQRAGE